MKIKGAIFDMDGTLIDSLMFWDYLWRRIGEEYMGNASFKPVEELDKNARTMLFADAMAHLKEYYKLPVDTDTFIRFASSGIEDFYKNVATVKTGAVRLLEHLKSQGIKLCLASATAMPELRYALKCHGLSQYFELVLSCSEIGVGKDRPDIYLQAMRHMELSPSDICVFEDSFVALETAKKAGFQTVGIFDKYNFEQERLKKSSDIYLDEHQALDALLEVIHN